MDNVLIDTGFWIALYNERDKHYSKANELQEYLEIANVLVPYPSLYETINTRLTKKSLSLNDFKRQLEKNNFEIVQDDDYKADSLEITFNSSLINKRPLSLVDTIIRQMLADEHLNINYLISFNPGDFIDICTRRGIIIISD